MDWWAIGHHMLIVLINFIDLQALLDMLFGMAHTMRIKPCTQLYWIIDNNGNHDVLHGLYICSFAFADVGPILQTRYELIIDILWK